jgi:hypothetical protein
LATLTETQVEVNFVFSDCRANARRHDVRCSMPDARCPMPDARGATKKHGFFWSEMRHHKAL